MENSARIIEALRQGMAAHRSGQLAHADHHYTAVLSLDRHNFDALHLLGLVRWQQRRNEEAERLIGEALRINPSSAEACSNLGIVLEALGRHAEALAMYDRALAINPSYANALCYRGDALRTLGRFEEALASYDRALAIVPDLIVALINRGVTFRALNRPGEALECYDKVLASHPNVAEHHYNRGNALEALGRYEEALASYDRALAIRPSSAEAWSNRGNTLNRLSRYEEALASCDRALAINPQLAEALSNRGTALEGLRRYEESLAFQERAISTRPTLAEAWLGRGKSLWELERLDEALAAYDGALAIRPDFPEAWVGRGNVVHKRKRFDEALAAYDNALAIKPDLAEAWLGRGNAFWELERLDEAFAAYDRALAINPDLAEAWLGRGNVLWEIRQPEQAFAAYDRAFALKPHMDYAEGERLHVKLHMCDWSNLDSECSRFLSAISEENRAFPPFPLLALASSAEQQLKCAQTFVKNRVLAFDGPLWRGERRSHDRIRIAYLSADFRQHVVATVLAGLIELHDRSRFEVLGVSFGRDDNSELRARLTKAFDRFHDVRCDGDRQIAEFLHDAEVDIAVDLMGHTAHSRLGILAHRPAPIQATYLGFPGTTGAEFTDYIIADPFVLPFDQQLFFTEKIVHLPESYQPTDSKRKIRANIPKRSEIGLPEEGFVFCCFNSSYKISPQIFDVWIRLLRSIKDSVLWLAVANDLTRENLRREAQQRGIDAARLVLTDRVDHEDYLARQVLADLFLDTLPYNAHGTGSNALAAGLPVLTCRGTTFAGRVGTSLLYAAGLPDLVTNSLEEYEALALKLATDGELLRSVRCKLEANRATCPLFDTDRYRRHIETAYSTMWEIHLRGENPRSFAVPAPAASERNANRPLPHESRGSSTSIAGQFKIAYGYHQSGRLHEAQQLYRQICAVDPDHVDSLHFLGVLCYQLGQHSAAIELIGRALTLNPDHAVAHYNLGLVLMDQGRAAEAVARYERALALGLDLAEVHNNLGIGLMRQDRLAEAVAHYERALVLKPDYAEVQNNLGAALVEQGKPAEAIACFERAMALKPDYAEAWLGRLQAKLRTCNWTHLDLERSRLLSAVRAGTPPCIPLPVLALASSPEDQLKCAQIFIRDKVLTSDGPLWRGERRPHDRIRIAYLSADFRQHVVATVLAGLIELHDRRRFEVLGVSFGPEDNSDLRARFTKAFDRFHDVRLDGDRQIAEFLHGAEVDIAVDLMGHTERSRPAILAHRPAPVQVSYLGYPATTGADFLDYVIADPIVLPFDQQPFFMEKIVHLPDCYLPGDSEQRQLADRVPARDELGLPEHGFVFCAFTQTYKITPPVFDVWMRLLRAVEGSALWLSQANDLATANLRREAQARGIDPARLIFAPWVGRLADHLTRQRQADLYLDTLPYNAHTTASNALWAGLPVLTCRGDTFASRVGASVLTAADLPELITGSLEEYEALALKLATDSELLRSIRGTLDENRRTCPLFDTDRYRRHIETAYSTMWEIHLRGENPRSFAVPAPAASD